MSAESSQLSILSEVVAASLGGALSSVMLFPLEVIKTKMQAVDHSANDRQQRSSNMLAFGKDLYRREGLSVFYHGFECSAFQSGLEKAAYFFCYTILKNSHRRLMLTRHCSSGDYEYKLSTATNVVLGYVAEWTHLPISLPIDAWTTAIQTQESKRHGGSKEMTTLSPLKLLLTMLVDQNRSFYKGLAAYVFLCFKPALQYTLYEQVKAAWLKSSQYRRQQVLTTPEAFLLGMIARTVATILLFPFLRAKVLLQTEKQQHPNDGDASSDIGRVLWKQWSAEGLLGVYNGLGPELTRGALSAAIMLAAKERIAFFVHNMILRSQRASTLAP